jgi:hypothetical protein
MPDFPLEDEDEELPLEDELLLLATFGPFRLSGHRLHHRVIKLLRLLLIHVRELHGVLRQLDPIPKGYIDFHRSLRSLK